MSELSLPQIDECRVRRGSNLDPSESGLPLPPPSTLSHARGCCWSYKRYPNSFYIAAHVMAPAASKSKAYSSGVATQAGTLTAASLSSLVHPWLTCDCF